MIEESNDRPQTRRQVQTSTLPWHTSMTGCCRISCLGKCGESRDGPQRAWQRLMQAFKKKKQPSIQQDGLKVFGLNHPRVFEHILQMTNANRCENFCAWPDNNAPPVPKLVRQSPTTAITTPQSISMMSSTVHSKEDRNTLDHLLFLQGQQDCYSSLTTNFSL